MLPRPISATDLGFEPLSNGATAVGLLATVALLALVALASWLLVMRRQRDQALDAARELEAALSALRNSNEFRSELLAVAAHDLRGATGMNRSLADLIARDHQTPPRLAEVAATIVATTTHMEQMVYRLLERAAAQDDDWTVTPVRFDLAKLVQQTTLSWRADARKKDLTLSASSAASVPVALDPMLTAEIITNLVSNAVKFTLPGGSVRLDLEASAEQLTLRVIDTGPGISVEDRPRLFRPFHPLSARPTGGESSTGLGLAIAKRLAELQQGELDVERSGANGTIFALRLPRSLADHPPPPAGRVREAAA